MEPGADDPERVPQHSFHALQLHNQGDDTACIYALRRFRSRLNTGSAVKLCMYVLYMVVFMGLLPFPRRLFFALSACVVVRGLCAFAIVLNFVGVCCPESFVLMALCLLFAAVVCRRRFVWASYLERLTRLLVFRVTRAGASTYLPRKGVCRWTPDSRIRHKGTRPRDRFSFKARALHHKESAIPKKCGVGKMSERGGGVLSGIILGAE